MIGLAFSTGGACAGPSTSFCFLGVNFRPQLLHSRMRRTPMLFVRLTPLLMDVDFPQ